jgi:hypothetical protein
MADAARKRAQYSDLFAVPAHQVGEIIDGVLYVQPRPVIRHAQATSVLGGQLEPAFGRGRGGPGGWIILDEPELHLGAEPDILVPDLAGWRRARVPELPDAAFISLPPDWACEVLSQSTQKIAARSSRSTSESVSPTCGSSTQSLARSKYSGWTAMVTAGSPRTQTTSAAEPNPSTQSNSISARCGAARL